MKKFLSLIIFAVGVYASYLLAMLAGAGIDQITDIRQLAWLTMIIVFGVCLFVLVYFGRKFFSNA